MPPKIMHLLPWYQMLEESGTCHQFHHALLARCLML